MADQLWLMTRIWEEEEEEEEEEDWLVFTTLDTDKIMNPKHFWSDPADMWIRIWINSEIRIRIVDHFWLNLDALLEVCAFWAQSSHYWDGRWQSSAGG